MLLSHNIFTYNLEDQMRAGQTFILKTWLWCFITKPFLNQFKNWFLVFNEYFIIRQNITAAINVNSLPSVQQIVDHLVVNLDVTDTEM